MKDIKNETIFATLDCRPVILDRIEAWWLINGRWQRLEHSEAFNFARVLGKDLFDQTFSHLPQLPKIAFQSSDKLLISLARRTPSRLSD